MRDALKKLVKATPGWRIARAVLFSCGAGLRWFVAIVLGLPVLAVLTIIEPIAKLRFCHIGIVDHIGWLAVNSYSYLGRWAAAGQPEKARYFFLMYAPDNTALFDVVSRHCRVISNAVVNHVANAIRPIAKSSRFFLYDHTKFRHFEPWCSLNRGVLTLSENEVERGNDWLKSVGIGPNDWFVCFHARDAAYNPNPYHDYRNCSVDSYLAAAEHITKLGGYAIRMGAKVDRPLKASDNPKIIDYATEHRSEFLDVFLSAKCRFFLGNTSGIITVPLVFGRPFAQANCIPYCDTGTKLGLPWIPKLLWSNRGQRYLTFREIFDRGLFSWTITSEEFVALCIEQDLLCVENSADEVLDLCLDMLDILEDIAVPAEARAVQAHYRNQFFPAIEHQREIPDVAPRFALRHKDLILT